MEKNKVLIVDDISENIETISEMIKDFDIDVKTANGGKEAIELIDSFKPDVILLDLMMPNVNGWDVIDHVRSKYSKSEMVIIVVSLLSNKDNVDECYELGVNDYITKPIIKARLTSFARRSSKQSCKRLKCLLQDCFCMSNAITSRRIYAFQRVGNT